MTHFPIAFVFGAALFDALAFLRRGRSNGLDFNVIGYWLMILGAIGSFGAVFSGLALSKWTIGGTGSVLRHHLFVWPAFTLIVALGTWRLLVGYRPRRLALIIYMAGLAVTCGLVGAAGFFGGEMLLGK
jgi:uncharacterized membrane protein